MTYAGDRVIFDADCHIEEWPTWLRDYADPGMRERMPLLWGPDHYGVLLGEAGIEHAEDAHSAWEQLQRIHAAPEYAEQCSKDVMARRQLAAFGGFRKDHRTIVLDKLGFAAQLVFNTFSMEKLQAAEASGDVPLVRAMSRAHNRGMVDFCSADARLMPTGYVPLSDPEQAADIAREAIRDGCRALVMASACPPGNGPTHIGLEPLWAAAAEAGTPMVMHVGGGGELCSPAFHKTGRENVPGFVGGEGIMRSLEVMCMPMAPRATLTALVYDGVLMRHPTLRIGIAEQGSLWIPAYLREVDSVATAFRKAEPRLQRLDLAPSEYVRRQVRVTPYPYEDVGWAIEQAGEEMFMFSSDYPHHEGGRKPIERFDAWLGGVTERGRQRFFAENFQEYIGLRAGDRVAA